MSLLSKTQKPLNRKDNDMSTDINTDTELDTIGKRVQHLRDAHAIQGANGNWNYSSYMLGMFNSLEFALATLEGREPIYRNPPRDWMCDFNRPPEQPPLYPTAQEEDSQP